jgi:hypothetical protein
MTISQIKLFVKRFLIFFIFPGGSPIPMRADSPHAYGIPHKNDVKIKKPIEKNDDILNLLLYHFKNYGIILS